MAATTLRNMGAMARRYMIPARWRIFFIPLMGLILILGCNSAATQEMPDLVLERINVADGTPSLANWTVRPGQRVTQAKVLTPNHSAFPEARLFYETSKGKTPQ